MTNQIFLENLMKKLICRDYINNQTNSWLGLMILGENTKLPAKRLAEVYNEKNEAGGEAKPVANHIVRWAFNGEFASWDDVVKFVNDSPDDQFRQKFNALVNYAEGILLGIKEKIINLPPGQNKQIHEYPEEARLRDESLAARLINEMATHTNSWLMSEASLAAGIITQEETKDNPLAEKIMAVLETATDLTDAEKKLQDYLLPFKKEDELRRVEMTTTNRK